MESRGTSARRAQEEAEEPQNERDGVRKGGDGTQERARSQLRRAWTKSRSYPGPRSDLGNDCPSGLKNS